ncbi:MAG: hypothetical protein U9N86_09205 [Bacteroidota bacterium]|nr:hypothetical protein [Bacteroidota bacterium]
MLVTNDGGVHWASYDAKFGVSGNTVTPVRFRSPEINISDVAAGMGAVQIRFHIHGPRLYYWMIDDLRLTEAYENDLILEDTWANFNGGFDEHIGHINYWPKSQFGSASEVSGTVEEEDMARTWLTLELEKDGESEFLEPGLYVACVKMWGEEEGDEDEICGMRIGWDKDDKGNNGYTYMYQAVDDDWAGTLQMVSFILLQTFLMLVARTQRL